ncbi:5-carboxymethyl-2-hydroxymuconate Delta-isomerase [Neptuniibacter sp. PT34_22]|uniref:5-carboxymethyl-2-hydroxymuconate Delta-isomerase n=1 Tax=Neptuniibacter sp. PT34_22 TaxID=3398205 RepID=UPI0039F5C34E
MPHLVIEYSKQIEDKVDITVVMEKVFQGAVAANLFAEKDIKVRANAYEQHMNGAGLNGLIHVSSRILSGRNTEQKTQLTQAVLTELKTLGLEDLSITVEVLDIDRDSYAKHIG